MSVSGFNFDIKDLILSMQIYGLINTRTDVQIHFHTMKFVYKVTSGIYSQILYSNVFKFHKSQLSATSNAINPQTAEKGYLLILHSMEREVCFYTRMAAVHIPSQLHTPKKADLCRCSLLCVEVCRGVERSRTNCQYSQITHYS